MYSPREIAQAAGVPESRVVAALGGRTGLVSHQDAVAIGRRLVEDRSRLFSMYELPISRPSTSVPLAVSSTLHIFALAAAIFVLGLAPAPLATSSSDDVARPDDMRLVFVNMPGPGGGGGGGGLLQKAPPPKAMLEGRRKLSSPMPERPKPIEPIAAPPEPERPRLQAETLPVVVAPIVTAPADARDRAGILQQARSEAESRGPGLGGGAGAGRGTGLGEGDGAGVGAGSGGGTGGGPFRPGSGIQPPRVLHEVKADYSEEARREGITGDVVLEIVVRSDGSVGDIKLLRGLKGGLNERAIQAVRQWRFAPATRQGVPVDVIVEVAVEFKLR